MPTFNDLHLLTSLRASLSEQSITVPTPVQEQSIPPLMQGRSLVAVSETGSGKTLAFVLPMLHQLKTLENEGSAVQQDSRPRGVVLVPGRELGEQVSKVFKSLTHGTRLRVRTALGGTKKQIARQNVSGTFEILVATPGRLEQILEEGQLKLADVRTIVLDEADLMLDAGFLPVVQRVLKACPKEVQRVLFSATMPQALQKAVDALFVKPPVQIRTKGSQQVVATLTTDNRNVPRGDRFASLATLLAESPNVPSMLFSNTREQCDAVAAWLKERGIDYASYRGQMDRKERRVNLERFRSGEVQLLLCTDLGGRGLDIDHVERIINMHLPTDIDNYLHRVGRTARAGREGLVVNFVTQRDEPLMAKLKRRQSKR